MHSFRFAGFSVQGTSHKRSGDPCQDSFLIRRVDTRILLVAVADGAGSAKHSDIGSKVAVHAGVDAAHAVLTKTCAYTRAVETGFSVATQAVRQEAERMGVAERDLSTTLILLVITPRQVTAGQVGDGAAVLLTRDEVVPITLPQHGEFVNSTTFLVGGRNDAVPVIATRKGIYTAVAAFTDGVEELALSNNGYPHKPFFLPLFKAFGIHESRVEFEALLKAYFGSEKVAERTSDDITIVLAGYTGMSAKRRVRNFILKEPIERHVSAVIDYCLRVRSRFLQVHVR